MPMAFETLSVSVRYIYLMESQNDKI